MPDRPDPRFARFYEQALNFQAAGNLQGLTKLIQVAYTAGLKQTDLEMLGALVESTLRFKPTDLRGTD